MKKNLTRVLLLIVAFSMIFGTFIVAEASNILEWGSYSLQNGEAKIASVQKGLTGTFVIPETVNGYPVVGIDYNAFNNCKYITKIVFHDGIKTIGDNAFSHCTGLESIELPDSVISLGDCAFYGCTNLKDIKLSENLESIGGIAFKETAFFKDAVNWEGNCLYLDNWLVGVKTDATGEIRVKDGCKGMMVGAFEDCESIESIVIPDGIKTLDERVFSYCKSLKNIEIPNSVTAIKYSAFCMCLSLESIEIPDSVTEMGGAIFTRCEKLKDIKLPQGITKISNDMFGMCAMNEITIPDSVTEIGKYAFDQCANLETIRLPKSVTTIGTNAFYRCVKLSTVEIPNSVKKIGDYAFKDCIGLKMVYFIGTPSEWLSVEVGEGNDYLNNAPLTYKSVTGGGNTGVGPAEERVSISSFNYANNKLTTNLEFNSLASDSSIIVAIYDGAVLAGTSIGTATSGAISKSLTVQNPLTKGKTYNIKAFIWNGMDRIKPIMLSTNQSYTVPK